jgi:hypothetical protein
MLGRAIEMALGGRSLLRDPQHAQDAGGEDVEGSGREGVVLNVCVVLHVYYLSVGGGGVLRGISVDRSSFLTACPGSVASSRSLLT